MAKKTTTRRGPGGLIVVQPAASPARRRVAAIASRAKHVARRGGTAVAKRAWERRATFVSPLVGYAMGYIQRENINIPSFGPLGKNGTIAAALFAASFFLKNEYVSHAFAAAAAVASYDYATTGSVHGVGRVGGQYDHFHRAIDQAG